MVTATNICVCIHAQPLHTIQFAPNPTDLRAKQKDCEEHWAEDDAAAWSERLTRDTAEAQALEQAKHDARVRIEIHNSMHKAWDLALAEVAWDVEHGRQAIARQHMAATHLPLFPPLAPPDEIRAARSEFRDQPIAQMTGSQLTEYRHGTNAAYLASTGGAGSCTDNSSTASTQRKRAKMGTSASRARGFWEAGAAKK